MLELPTLAALYARVPSKRIPSSSWPFGRKFSLWLEDHGLSLSAFAARNGFKQQTLQRWTKQGVRLPAAALPRIAAATHLPAAYWLDDAIPYPPPVEYANLADQVTDALKACPLDDLREILAMLRDPDDRRRTLALRRAARSS